MVGIAEEPPRQLWWRNAGRELSGRERGGCRDGEGRGCGLLDLQGLGRFHTETSSDDITIRKKCKILFAKWPSANLHRYQTAGIWSGRHKVRSMYLSNDL
jgi:hypothetical protein